MNQPVGVPPPPPSLGVRDLNRLRVIESIYLHPGCSRTDIARRTGLSRGTVSTVAEELDRAELIREYEAPEEEQRRRGTGRRPTLLSLVPGAGFAIGIDIGHQHVRVIICDLAGEPVAEQWSAAQVDEAPSATLDLANDLVRRALRDAGVAPQRVLGAGIGLAAPIDPGTGEVRADGILPGWQGVVPAAEMRERLGVSVQLANDADAGALGENVFGAGRGVDDMIYIRLSAGVGGGLILAGQPYRGARGIAGEIGHVCVRPDGLICRCGNRGCLETVASPVAVARQLEHVIDRPAGDQLPGLIAAGDRRALRAVADAGEAVGFALSAVVNVLNPELVVVGGELAAAGEALLDPIRATVHRHSLVGAATTAKVITGVLGDRAEVLGAAALILARSPAALAERMRAAS
ncbi:ROK family transcriptional regulator [Streptomyces sp. HPF1205]|uniref:ROK family transcriptional regulator n=1 Tax=Streptomyces sp. HPF1205 TaxID=2873262 RepID=UPI001CEDC4E3|nr:ROK family transcriptional regulator [Streptomyces sp. HPF1205]